MAAKTEKEIKELVDGITSNLKSLEDIRRPWEPQVDEILTYIYHGRRRINDTPSSKGHKTGQYVYDGTALGALNLLTDGLTGYTISKSFKWFGYTLPTKIHFARTSALRSTEGRRLDSFPEVKRWLQDAEEAMTAAYLASNLYDIAPDMVRDAASVGTVTVNIDEDIAHNRTIFSVPHFRECYVAENYMGLIDTNYRVYDLTLKQLVEKFGYDKMVEVDTQFAKDYETNRNTTREVIHAREPRSDRDPTRMDGGNKPFSSVWILRSGKSPAVGSRQPGSDKLLLESGTDNQSFATWRWRKNSDEWLGRSPAWDSFVDVMTANQMGRTNLIAGHKMVEPALVGPSDLRGQVQRGPNGWTSVDDMNQLPRPLQENIQLPFGLEMQDRLDGKIKETFHVDFFLMLSQAALAKVELTATQVIEMSGEKAAVLGPRIGRMETEALEPIDNAVFAIEQRAGRIPVPPDILREFAGGNIEIQYLGPLAQAQKKLFKSQGIRQGLASIAPLVEVFPEVLDVINPTETARDILDSTGFPQKDMNDPDVVAQIRKDRQAAVEQQKQFEQAIETAKAMPAAGKEVSPDSALGVVMDAAGGAVQ